jgi:hypothetical protein
MPGPHEKQSQEGDLDQLCDLSFNEKVRAVLDKVDLASSSGEEVRLSSNEAALLMRHFENSKVAVRVTRSIFNNVLNPKPPSGSEQ